MNTLASRFVQRFIPVLGVVLWSLSCLTTAQVHAATLGEFENATDVGKIELQGSAEFLPDKAQYRIQGSDANIWANEDAFQFLWKKTSGDLLFSMDVDWVGEGKMKHRKACAMVRRDLEADSPYVDVAVHGDGLIEMQCRKEKGAMTLGVRTPIQAPATVKLERDGDVFTVSVAKPGGPFQPVGAMSLMLPDPVHVGLAVCSHDAGVSETAVFSNVVLKNRLARPNEKRVRETSLETVSIETGERSIVFRERNSFEAPNWSPDGKLFYINRQGAMCTIPVEGGKPARLDTGTINRCNNDHGLSFDGKWLAISAATGSPPASKIYILRAGGGSPRLITPLAPSYWHGWSPDGKTLTFCGRRNDNYDIYTIPAEGGEEKRLTMAEGLDDGPEYTPDGGKIYFQSERAGLMKIWRMNPDGTGQEQVTSDTDYADWFPHPSPDGKWIVFMSYDKSVAGHPANKDVVLRLMPMAGGKPKVIATLFGGQGTINVPSWSPDSKHVAFVSYRHVLPVASLVGTRASDDLPIDVNLGKQLMRKFQAGETLTPEDQAYLERVKQEIRKRAAGRRPGPAPNARTRPIVGNTSDWSDLVPITDMTAPYKGEDGGLYGRGRNEPPEVHRAAHLSESEKIRPLDENGRPSDTGKIGLISIGFSNTSIEWEDFRRTANADPQKSPCVVIVNGAIGGRSAVMWAWDGADVLSKAEQDRLDKEMDVLGMPKTNRRSSPGLDKDTWPTLAKRIEAAGLSPKQVQVCWLKHVEANPKPLGEFPAHARTLQADITAVLQIARHHYPNLRIVYLSSRTFGGWSGRSSGSPEPYAYESGFGTRWVVQSQINGNAQMNYDPARGEVKAPLVLWGPYLWACGNSPRKIDGLTWTQSDVRPDQLHPNESGCKKTTTLMLNFFKTNEGPGRWFLKPGETGRVTLLPK